MAQKKKTDIKKFKTPVARAIFPYLTTPDTGKYAPKGGQYKVTLILDPKVPEHAAFIEQMEAEAHRCFEVIQARQLADGNKAMAKVLKAVSPIKPHFTKNDDGEKVETGLFEITFKRSAVFENRRTGEIENVVIPLFDGAGNRLPSTVEVWGGSQVAVAFFTKPYIVEKDKVAGASIRLSAVQIRELVTRGGETASDFGFETDGDAIVVAPRADDGGASNHDGSGDEEEGVENSGADF